MILLLYSRSVVLSVAMIIVRVQSLWTEFEFTTIQNAEVPPFFTNLKVMHFNRTTVTISGDVKFTDDIMDYDCEWNAFYSSRGNNQYRQVPFKVQRDSCCNFLETVYFKEVYKSFTEVSDLPKKMSDELYCVSLKKRTYTVKDFVFDVKPIPKFMDTGTYKCDFNIYKKGAVERLCVATALVRLY